MQAKCPILQTRSDAMHARRPILHDGMDSIVQWSPCHGREGQHYYSDVDSHGREGQHLYSDVDFLLHNLLFSYFEEISLPAIAQNV